MDALGFCPIPIIYCVRCKQAGQDQISSHSAQSNRKHTQLLLFGKREIYTTALLALDTPTCSRRHKEAKGHRGHCRCLLQQRQRWDLPIGINPPHISHAYC